jgi:peptide/nickel transport system ATP-binding protein
MRDLRGDRLAMIFQEPMTSLNPAYTIGEQIIRNVGPPPRACPRHRRGPAPLNLLQDVRIPSPEHAGR